MNITEEKLREIFREEADRMHTGFMVIAEGIHDSISTLGEKIEYVSEKADNLETRFDSVENRLDSLENRTIAMQTYLTEILEPRVADVESVYLR